MEIKEHYLCLYLETAVAVAGSGDGEGAVTGRTGQPAPGEGRGQYTGLEAELCLCFLQYSIFKLYVIIKCDIQQRP